MPTHFEESRRLTGANVYFDSPGAALETARGVVLDDAGIQRWRLNVAQAREWLNWPSAAMHAHRHATGVTLAFAAPEDQLTTATEVNEWALAHALGLEPRSDDALAALDASAACEANPQLMACVTAARQHAIPVVFDDEFLTLGEGKNARSWPLAALPEVGTITHALPSEFARIPKAMVTGSNGKTTTVRLLAALLKAHGETVGLSSTDGIVVDGQVVEGGDFSGPMGARSVLRNPAVSAAVLEAARGGLLRRGLAVTGVDVAIVTNVSADHFGEYGVHAIEDIAHVKLLVAQALHPHGTLLLNAGNSALVAGNEALTRTLQRGWFALDFHTASARGPLACGMRDGRLVLRTSDTEHDLGVVADMPLSAQAHARYNIENMAAAALAAHLMGVTAATIASTLRTFGRNHADNPGRLQHWTLGKVDVLLDYAHNPEGLTGLLQVARALHPHGRLGLLLGQAGNRRDEDLTALANAAAAFNPDRVWLKDIGGDYLRERASGEAATYLRSALLQAGLQEDALPVCLNEAEAAAQALAWAQPGDLLVLPVHESGPRDVVVGMIDAIATRTE